MGVCFRSMGGKRWLAGLCYSGLLLGQFPAGGIPGPCTSQQAREYPGEWIRKPDDVTELAIAGLNTAQRASILAKTDQVLAILRKAYPAPRGVDVWHYRWAYRSLYKTLPVPMSTNLIFMEYWCYARHYESGQPRLVVMKNSDAWVQVEFNTLGQALAGELPEGFELPTGNAIYASPIELGPAFRGVPTLKGTIETNTTVLLLARDDRLPLRPVTQEEILRVHAAYWRTRKQQEAEQAKKDLAGAQKALAEHKREAGQSEELFARNGVALRERVEWYTAQLAKASEEIVSLPQRAEAQLAAIPQEQRQSQAVVGPINAGSYADLQFGPGRMSRPLWTMDGVLDASLPRNAVHYMTVFWRRVPSSPAYEAAFNEFLEQVDFDALRALLDR